MTKPNLKTEDLVLNIIVNGNAAQSEIGKVSRSLRDSKQAADSVEDEMKRLEKQGLKNTRQYKELSKQLETHNKAIQVGKTRLGELNQSMKLEDQTISTLRRSLSNLIKLRNQSTPGSEQYKQYNAQIAEVSNRLNYLRTESDRTGNALTRMGGRIKGFFTSMVGGLASVTALFMGVRKAITEYAQFDDVLADVQKTTNLTKEEVIALNKELEKIDTRTSQEDLLGLSRIGGKLGISDANDIAGFVRATNQLVVALNEDLGGNVEDTVNKVGKLVDIFGVKEIYGWEDGLLRVGSAINELGMASTANEGYMVEFSRRMAGIAPLAGISIQEVLGLGATLDQFGQTAEVSGTALSRLFLNLANDSATFAKYAGMEVKEFQELLETDFMPAFIKVLEGVKDNAGGINELAATLGDLGIEGGRVIGVLGALANNTDVLTGQIGLSNKAFSENISLTEEYNTKNETAAATLDRAQKQIKNLWRALGQELFPAMTRGITIMNSLIQALITIIRFVSDNIKLITTLSIAIVGYQIAISAASLAMQVKSFWLRTVTALQWAWNAALAANPIGLVVAGLAALTAGIALYTRRLGDAAYAQKTLSDVTREANKETSAEVQSIERLQAVLGDNTRSIREKTGAVRALRDIMPDVLQQYTDEEIRLGKATTAMDKHIAVLKQQAKVRVAQQRMDELMRRRMKIEDGSVGFMTSLNIGLARLSGGSAGDVIADELSAIDAAIDALTNSIVESHVESMAEVVHVLDEGLDNTVGTIASKRKGLEEEISRLKAAYDQIAITDIEAQKKNIAQRQALQKQLDALDGRSTGSGTKRKTPAEIQSEKDQKAYEKMLADQQRYREQVLFNAKTLIEQEEIQYRERLEQAGLYETWLLAQKAKESGEVIEISRQQADVLEALESEHRDKILKIKADEDTARINQQNQDFERRKIELQTQQNLEIASLTSLEDAKRLLREKYLVEDLSKIKTFDDAKLQIQKKHQDEVENLTIEHHETMLAFLEALLEAEEIARGEGFSVMSDEQKAKLEEQILTMRALVAQLRAIKNSGDGEDSEKTDIFGMTDKDWEKLYEHIDQAKASADTLIGAWDQYNKFVAAGEKKKLQEFEESTNKQKDILDKRLKAGAISQEQYNAQIEKLDKDLAKKRARMEYEQAKRERSVALMSAIVSTAAGVARAFKDYQFPYSAIIAAAVGAAGALQIGTIARQPLPSLSGREDGGYLVRRSQDGKIFNASHDPDRRGYVGKPTVIVGENGNEFVANAQAVENPSVRPILDIIDIAQRNGTISTLRLENILPRAQDLRAAIPGRQAGGTVSGSTAAGVSPADLSAMNKMLDKATQTMDRLDKTIARGIKAEVSLLGKNGFYEKDQEYKNIQDGASL